MIHKQKQLVEVLDWLGVIIVVTSYTSVVLGYASPTAWPFLTGNIVGSALIGYSCWKKKDTQPVVLNFIWIAIAVIGLLHYHG